MLTNVPRIRDVEVLIDLLVGLGATVCGRGHVDASGSLPDGDDRPTRSRRSWAGCADRSSFWVRCSRAGARRVSRSRAATFRRGGRFRTHLQALAAMGAVPLDEPGHALDAPWGLTGASFYLDEASVTGTETALLAAAAAKGRTEIRHAAMEPHVAELCRFLRAMGVSIEGEGTSTIRVEAPARFKRREPPARRRLHRSRELGRRRGDHGRRHRSDRRALDRSRGRRRPAQEDGPQVLVGRRALRRRAVAGPDGRAPHHDRAVAGLSERHGEPRDGAGDAGRRARRSCTTGCTSCASSRSSN